MTKDEFQKSSFIKQMIQAEISMFSLKNQLVLENRKKCHVGEKLIDFFLYLVFVACTVIRINFQRLLHTHVPDDQSDAWTQNQYCTCFGQKFHELLAALEAVELHC